jgi:hypothetical protein
MPTDQQPPQETTAQTMHPTMADHQTCPQRAHSPDRYTKPRHAAQIDRRRNRHRPDAHSRTRGAPNRKMIAAAVPISAPSPLVDHSWSVMTHRHNHAPIRTNIPNTEKRGRTARTVPHTAQLAARDMPSPLPVPATHAHHTEFPLSRVPPYRFRVH